MSATTQISNDTLRRKRYCLTLDLKDDPVLIEEYKRLHQSGQIWPEIPTGMKEVGILNMEIYLLGTRMFMVIETEPDFDYDRQMMKLSKLPRQQEWEEFTWKFQNPLSAFGSGKKWMLMENIYKLEQSAKQ
ncbi:MAG TPA: L-rhamnose mutarotase [Bacteroidota bacterium]